jgi:hypothetical protein
MVPLNKMNHHQQYKQMGAYFGMCWLDAYIMWPAPNATWNCTREADPNTAYAAILANGTAARLQTRQLHQHSAGSVAEGYRPRQAFCIQFSQLPLVLRPHARTAWVDGYRLPAAENIEE